MLDYLAWRGDLLFSQAGVNDVDALVFSTLSYIGFEGLVTEDLQQAQTLQALAQNLLALPDARSRCRVEKDLVLLEAAANSRRFGNTRVTFYRNVFNPQEELQFAAVTFLLDDGCAFLAFRGTDNTLVGWKEDFNMSFQPSVPAQRLAQEYVQRFAAFSGVPLYLGGHSKGGNLAVYAGAKCGEALQPRILNVYNFDGPGFTQTVLEDPGYKKMVGRVKTMVPQFSVFGLMLERQENLQVVQSSAVGLLQHEPYSWQVMGKDFVFGEALAEGSVFLDRTLTTWLAGLDNTQRGEFFDGIFGLLMQENASQPKDVLRPQNVLAALKTIHMEENKRRMLGNVLQNLVDTAKSIRSETEEVKKIPRS